MPQCPPSSYTYDKEAISSLEEVQLFLNNRGYTQESLQLGKVMDSLYSKFTNDFITPNNPVYDFV